MHDEAVCTWTSQYSCEELIERILIHQPLPLTAYDLFHDDVVEKDREKDCEAELTASERRFLQGYRQKFGGRLIFDLSQNPETRGRTSLIDSACPCLTTSSGRLWNESKKRCLLGLELLAATGVPTTPSTARAALVDRVHPEVGLTDSAITRMCGNAMHIPCVGFAILVAALCVSQPPAGPFIVDDE